MERAAVSPVQEGTPTTNRGVTVSNFGVHWAQGTVFNRSPEDVCDALSREYDGLAFESVPGQLLGYECMRVGPGRSKVCYSPGRVDVLVILPGEACEMLGMEKLAALDADLEVRWSRTDYAWDLAGFTPRDVESWWHAGQMVTRAHRDSWDQHNNPDGYTFNIGSRASSRYLRCYDRRGNTRVELECKGGRAALFWLRLRETHPNQWSRLALGFLRDFVDFRDTAAAVKPADCPLLAAWAAFVGDAERLGVPMPRKPFTLDRARSWVHHQVAATFAMVADSTADPVGFMRDVYRLGVENRRPRHRGMLAAVGTARRVVEGLPGPGMQRVANIG